jgi:hypothetical protein
LDGLAASFLKLSVNCERVRKPKIHILLPGCGADRWPPLSAADVLKDKRDEQGMNKGQPMQMLRSFLKCERGATAIEYAIIAGGIALAIVAG